MALLLPLAGSAYAESGFWTGASNAVYQLSANWSGFAYPVSRCKYATFNGSGNGITTIDVGSGLVFDAIIFDTTNAAAYTIGSGGAGAQTLAYYGAYRSLICMENSVANNQVFNANLQGTAGNVMQRSTAGTLTFAGNMWNSAASGAGTFAFYGAGNTFISGIISNNNGSGTATLAITKYGAGTLTLSKTNTYTGTTTVSGGALTFNRQTGALASNTPLTFGSSGIFNMDNTGASGALAQSLGALTFNAGEGIVQTTRATANDESITFSSLAARTAGASGNFVNGGGANGVSNGFVLTGVATGFVDKGIFYGGADYASMDGAGTYVRALAYGTDTNAVAADTITAGRHVKLTATPANQNSISLLSLNLSGGGVSWAQNASQTLTVPGILKSGGGGVSTISGGTAVTGGAELVVRTDTSPDLLTISTLITGAYALTKSGAGTLTLANTNTYTGTTTVNAGTLAYGTNNAISTGAVTINGGTLDMGSYTDSVGTVTLTAGSIAGSGTLTATSYIMNNQGDTSVSVVLGGPGGLTKTTPGTLTLSNTNTYTGATQISGGILTVTSLKNGGVPSSIGASANTALNLDFKAGTQWSTLRYIGPGDDTDRLLHVDLYGGAILDASGTGPLRFTNTGSASLTGVNYPCWIDFTGSNTGDNTFNLVIPTAGTGVGIIKSGPGRWILTGASTYAGSTDVFYPYDGAAIIMGGTLAVTWVANGSTASPLGSSTSASAKLVLNGGTLQYIGTGATSGKTDRLFTLGVGPTAGALDASSPNGSGSPFFLSNNGSIGFCGTGTRTLTMTGSNNTDSNTLAAVIGNSGSYATSLTKSGAGKWILTGTSTYSGPTTITNGTLVLGSSGSINGTSGIIVNGTSSVFEASSSVAVTKSVAVTNGTLRGRGTINAVTTIAGIGTLAAGSATTIGTLNLGSTLTLSETGGVVARINKSESILTADKVNMTAAAGSIAYLGTLTVVATGNTLASGDKFYLFGKGASGTLSGSFTNLNLPALTGLEWNTNGLVVDGSIEVVTPPGMVSKPDFRPYGGFYYEAQTVTITSATAGATIYYTTDGTTPTTNSTVYTAPIAVPTNTNMTIRAFATMDGLTDSAVAGETYALPIELVWINPAGGSWPVTNNWTNGVVGQARGIPVRFDTLTLTSNCTVTLDSSPTVGTLTFGDIGNQYSWIINSGVYGGALTLDAAAPGINVVNQTATMGAILAGTNGVIKSGNGTLTLSAANTYSGDTAVSAGTVKLGASNVIPNGAGKGNVSLTGTLDMGGFSEQINGLAGTGTVDNTTGTGTNTLTVGDNGAASTFGGVIRNSSGTLALTKTGAGTLTLTGTNTYTGTTTVNAGILSVSQLANGGVASGIGQSAATAASLVLGGGTLRYTGLSQSIDRSFTLAAATTSTIDVSTNTLTITGASANTAGNLVKAGTGTLVLAGTNTHTGSTTINAGILSVSQLANGGVASGIGQSANAAGNLVLGGGTLQYTGASQSINRSFTLTAGTTGTIEVTSGTTTLTITGASAGTTGNLVKTGAGTLVMEGVNLHTGQTIVSNGTFILTGQLSGSAGTTVNSGTMMAGTGTVARAMTVGGTLAPGVPYADQTGQLTVGGYTNTSTGKLSLQLGGTATGEYDQVITGGSVSLAGQLEITTTGGYEPQRLDTIKIIDKAGAGAVTGTFDGLPEGQQFCVGGLHWFAISYAGGDGNDVVLNFLYSRGTVFIIQ